MNNQKNKLGLLLSLLCLFSLTSFGYNFNFTLKGKLVTEINTELGQYAKFPLRGVTLRIQDGGDHTHMGNILGEAYSDANGNFEFHVNESQIGPNIQIRIVAQAKSGNDFIVVDNNRNYKELVFSQDYNHTKSGTVEIGEVYCHKAVNQRHFLALHWAYSAYLFAKSQFVNSEFIDARKILIHVSPGTEETIYNFSIPQVSGYSSISVHKDRYLTESVIYELYGHHINFLLTGVYSSTPEAESFPTLTVQRNYGAIAWQNGFAIGFAAIVDNYYKADDNEYKYFTWQAPENGPLSSFDMENRNRLILNNGNAADGTLSEYHIASLIYDLYDGADKFPSNTPASAYSDNKSGNGLLNIGYDDNLVDNLSLSGSTVFNPLIGHPINDIREYISLLNSTLNACDKSKLHKVISQNGVMELTTNQPLKTDFINTDGIGQGPYGYQTDVNNLVGFNQRWNFGAVYTNQMEAITHSMNVSSGAFFGINADFTSGNIYGYYIPPQLYTNVFTEICENTLTIDNGGMLQLGGDNRIGMLTVNKDAVLYIKSNAIVNVNWGSKIIVKNGGKIICENTPSVNLFTNGTIEIQDGGIVEVAPNSSFKTNGGGYININTSTKGISNFTAQTPNSNAKVEINGQSNQHKIIQVENGSLSADKSLSMFKVSKGTVTLGDQCMLDIESETYLIDLKIIGITKSNGTKAKHSGLYLYGQQSSTYVYGCVFEDADAAIRLFNSKGPSDVKIGKFSLLTIRNCDNGIISYGKGVDISNSKFWSNKGSGTAISLNTIQFPSTITNTNISGFDIGVSLIGTVSNQIFLKDCSIELNSTYGVYSSNCKPVIQCSKIINNSALGTNNGNNIRVEYGSYLGMDPNLYNGAAGDNNLYSDNSTPISSLRSFAIQIDNANSNFENRSSLNSITGSLMPFQCYAASNNGFPVPVFSSVLATGNYWGVNSSSPNTNVTLDNGWTNQRILFEDNQLSLTSEPVYRCNPISNPSTSSGTGASMFISSKPSIILHDGTDLKDRFIAANDLFNQNEIELAMEEFQYVLTYSYSNYNTYPLNGLSISEFMYWYDVIDFSYSRYLDCLSQIMSDQNSPLQHLVDVNKLIDVQQTLLNQYSQYGENKDLIMRFKLDRALMFNLLNNRDECLSELQVLLNDNQDASTAKLLNYYMCAITLEKNVAENSIPKAQYFEEQPCLNNIGLPDFGVPTVYTSMPLDPIVEGEFHKTSTTSLKQIANNSPNETQGILIYPNPIIDNINIKSPGDFGLVDVIVSDLAGKMVYSGAVQLYSGNNSLSLPTSLNNGIYSLTLKSNNLFTTKKIVISK